jgi:hypothetical protein
MRHSFFLCGFFLGLEICVRKVLVVVDLPWRADLRARDERRVRAREPVREGDPRVRRRAGALVGVNERAQAPLEERAHVVGLRVDRGLGQRLVQGMYAVPLKVLPRVLLKGFLLLNLGPASTLLFVFFFFFFSLGFLRFFQDHPVGARRFCCT